MSKTIERKDRVVVRFAGDSGDGMQLTGSRFTDATAVVGNDLATLPDFPAEIRAPAGTPHGVSAFQIHFASRDILTPGDHPNVLVAMNPAALITNVGNAREGRHRAGERGRVHQAQPAEGRLRRQPAGRRVAGRLPGLPRPDDQHDRPRDRGHRGRHVARRRSLEEPVRTRARVLALRAPHRTPRSTGSRASSPTSRRSWRPTPPPSGRATTSARRPSCSRSTTRSRPPPPRRAATATSTARRRWRSGLIAASVKSGLGLFYASYPITPASELLHSLSRHKRFGVRTVQAEDEIAAAGMALGAAFAGQLGVTATSGPGMDLKAETISLAVAMELPMVIVDVQRAGPSTGMPTKTEQGDLLMALLRPPRRVAAADRGRRHPGRLLRRRDRGRPHRRELPHAGRAAGRHVPVQLLRAVAAARPRRAARHRPRLRHRAERRRRLPALRARREAGAPVGGAGHARAAPPHRRAGEGGPDAATSPTSPRTTST